MPTRAWWLGLLFLGLVLIIAGRLVQLQILRGSEYARIVHDSRLVVELVPAKRGRIVDRHAVPLVDNRAVYDLSVVIEDLEVSGRRKRAIPFYRLDSQALDTLLAHLGARLPRDPAVIREATIGELLRFPGVALRFGRRGGRGDLELLALPRVDFAMAASAVEDAEATDADPTMAAALVPLAESGLLCDDPREALQRELVAKRSQGADLLLPRELDRACTMLGDHFDVPADLVQSVIRPFAPLVRLRLPPEGEVPGPPGEAAFAWHLLTDDNRQRAEDNLARFLGAELLEVHDRLRVAIRQSHEPPHPTAWFFVPSARLERLADLLPPDLAPLPVAVDDAPPARERMFVIQGDHPDELRPGSGMFSLLVNRLATTLDLDPDDVAGLIIGSAEEISAVAARREYRMHHIAFDTERLCRLCRELSQELSANGLDVSVLDLEEDLTRARRLADREWRGQTRKDPISLVRDVPPVMAVTLCGTGRDLPDQNAYFDHHYHQVEPRYPGLRVTTRLGREYLFAGRASHIFGWLGKLSAEYDRSTALLMGLDPAGWTGRASLESRYDELLQGLVGTRKRMVTPTGYDLLHEEDPVAGSDLHITLDMELQKTAEDAIDHWWELAEELGAFDYYNAHNREEAVAAHELAALKGIAGAVLVDCHDGAILAMASSPRYDLNAIRTEYSDLADPSKHPGQPLHDYAAEAWEPPGSTVKPLIGLAALMDGAYALGEKVRTNGFMAYWRGRKVLRDHRPYHVGGTWTMRTALQKSSNTFFATMAEKIGPERLAAWYDRLGFGRCGSIDVSWQEPGYLPSPANKRPWLPNDTWRMGIGQYLSASPLQLVTIACLVANGGTIIRPYFHREALRTVTLDRLDIPAEYLNEIRAGMEMVTGPEGTATKLVLADAAAGIKVAAKTGTSEWGNRDMRAAGEAPDHAWLIGYAPAEAPVVAFAIYIRCGYSGGRACSGVAKRILEVYFQRYGHDGGHRSGLAPLVVEEALSAPPQASTDR